MRVIAALAASVFVVAVAVAAVAAVGPGDPARPRTTTTTTTATTAPPGTTGSPTTAPSEPPVAGDGRVPAAVLDFVPGYGGPSRLAVMGTAPVDPDDPAHRGDRPATPGLTYVAATGLTGCRVPVRAELWRAGATVYVRFVGGVDRPECYRAVTPFAQFAVDARRLRGVTTVVNN
ncbi:MAG TPA: hypothetical protein VKB57_17225 [Acidimicrobiales bacterium]|nr:hypothetical protein [Acidimicrobiales bacterium]